MPFSNCQVKYRRDRFVQLLLLGVLVFCSLPVISSAGKPGKANLLLREAVTGNSTVKVSVGDVVNIEVFFQGQNEQTTGVSVFLDLDDRYLELIPASVTSGGMAQPFVQGSYLNGKVFENHTLGDVIGDSSANKIPLFQLVYSEFVTGGFSGSPQVALGDGVIATFSLRVIEMPPSQTTGVRVVPISPTGSESGYFIKDDPGSVYKFGTDMSFTISGLGLKVPVLKVGVSAGAEATVVDLNKLVVNVPSQGNFVWVLSEDTKLVDIDQDALLKGQFIVSTHADSIGFRQIELTITDIVFGISCVLPVRIYSASPISGVPVTGGIPNVTLEGSGASMSFNLNDYYFDADNTDQEIAWTSLGQNETLVEINPITQEITFEGLGTRSRTEEIVLTVTDPDGNTASDTIFVSIKQEQNSASLVLRESVVNGSSTAKISIGDIVNIEVFFEGQSEQTTGVRFFLDFDDLYLELIPASVTLEGVVQPFAQGTYLNGEVLQNNTQGDVIGDSNANMIPMFQLAYSEFNLGGHFSHQPVAFGNGIVAYFSLRVIGIPPDQTTGVQVIPISPTGNESGYFIKDDPGRVYRFGLTTGMTFTAQTQALRFFLPTLKVGVSAGDSAVVDLKTLVADMPALGNPVWTLSKGTTLVEIDQNALLKGQLIVWSHPDSVGFRPIELTVKDTISGTSAVLPVRIYSASPISGIPVTGGLPDLIINQDLNQAKEIDLDEFYFDANFGDEMMAWVATSLRQTVDVEINPATNRASFSVPSPEGVTTDTFLFTVINPNNNSSVDTMLVRLIGSDTIYNRSPRFLRPFPEIEIGFFGQTTRNLAAFVQDIDDPIDDLKFGILPGGDGLLFEIQDSLLTVVAQPGFFGVQVADVIVIDPHNGTDVQRLTVKVEQTNSEIRLLDSNVLSLLYRDDKLWVGTQKGLSLYDGKQATHFTVRQGIEYVYSLFQDISGNLWIGGVSNLSKYDGTQVISVDPGATGIVDGGIAQDSEGNLWVSSDNSLLRYDGVSWQTFRLESTDIGRINVLLFDGQGALWLGTEKGVWLYNIQSQTWEEQVRVSQIQALIKGASQTFWYGSASGEVGQYDTQTQRVLFFGTVQSPNEVTASVSALLRDRDANIWIGTSEGVSFLRRSVLSTKIPILFTDKDGLAHNNVWAISEDGSGNLWFGTAGGLSRFDGQTWVTFKAKEPDLISTVVGGSSLSEGGFSPDGTLVTGARLRAPRGVYQDQAGCLYILDTGNHRIRKVNPETNTIITVAGSGPSFSSGYAGDGDPATEARLNGPRGFYVDSSGNIFIADTGNHRIRKVNTQGTIETVAGNGTSKYSGDGGEASEAGLNRPEGIFVDEDLGEIYIADTGNHRIRKVDVNGIITTVAGVGKPGFSGDGGSAAEARLNAPSGVYVDVQFHLGDHRETLIYIADTENHRIRWVFSGVINTIAGGSEAGTGTLGDGGLAIDARLNQPRGMYLDPQSNDVFIADTGHSRIRRLNSRNGTIQTVAGSGTSQQELQGLDSLTVALRTSLNAPSGLFKDKDGNLYIADTGHHRILKMEFESAEFVGNPLFPAVGPALPGRGPDLVKSVASSDIEPEEGDLGDGIRLIAGGYTGEGGSAVEAGLLRPTHAIADADGHLFIADGDNFQIRRVHAKTGVIGTVAGTGAIGYTGDGGPATEARIGLIWRMELDSDGNLYLVDRSNHVIRRVDTKGVITTVAGTGSAGFSGDGGPAVQARLSSPLDIAIDQDGNMFIADFLNHRIRMVEKGTGRINTVAGNGEKGSLDYSYPPLEFAPTYFIYAKFSPIGHPREVVLDPVGNLLVIVGGPNEEQGAEGGHICLIYARDGSIGDIEQPHIPIFVPVSMVISRNGNLVYGDATKDFSEIVWRFLHYQGLSFPFAYLGNGTGFGGDGEPLYRAFWDFFSPEGSGGLAVDLKGNLLIADRNNHRIRKVDLEGETITTVAGVGVRDGLPATQVPLAAPEKIAIDKDGHVFFADRDNNRIRRIDAVTGQISTVVGTSIRVSGRNQDGQPPGFVTLTAPRGVSVGKDGTLFVADTEGHTVLLVDSSSLTRLVAGKIEADPGFSGDGGPASEALLNEPSSVAEAGNGNLYIADTKNHRIRKVDSDGIITTVAGNGVVDEAGNGMFSGEGGAATEASLDLPTDVLVDGDGNLYIADTGNNRIRKVDSEGVITTVAGTGNRGHGFDGGPATQTRLNAPTGIALDGDGNLYIADTGNNRIRRVESQGVITAVAGLDTLGRTALSILKTPRGIAITDAGDLLISDSGNNRILRVNGFAAKGKVDQISADFDGDGQVGFIDFVWFARQFGNRREDPTYNFRIDLDGDGVILFQDFLLFIEQFIGSNRSDKQANLGRSVEVNKGNEKLRIHEVSNGDR